MKLPRLPRRQQPALKAVRHAAKGPRGRALAVYFVPSMLVGILLLALLSLVTLQALTEARRDADQAMAGNAMQSLAIQLAAAVEIRRQQLLILSELPQLYRALAGGEPERIGLAAQDAAAMLDDVLQLRLIAAGTDLAPDPTGAAPLGYAGVDMVRAALAGRQPLAEVHQLASGAPYVALAVPVRRDGQVLGALFGAWPMKTITRVTLGAPTFPGDFQVQQRGGAVLADSGAGQLTGYAQSSEEVAGTIWKLVYDLRPVDLASQAGLIPLFAGAGVLVLLLSAFLQHRVLGRELRRDMATLVNLGEAIFSGEGTGERTPQVSCSRDAVLLLTDLARKRHQRGGTAAASETADMAESQEQPSDAMELETLAPAAAFTVEELHALDIPERIFRAYDVRGLAAQDLTPKIVFALAQAFATKAREQGIAQAWLAHDARTTSPSLYKAFGDGLVDQGMLVAELGQVPVAPLYYAMHTQPECAAVMVTGSHNPPEYNGFKLYLNAEPVQGEALRGLRDIAQAGGFRSRGGSREQHDLTPQYLAAVSGEVQLARSLKVVVDGGNGVAGEFACELLRALGCEVEPLFCDPDGSFPNHHPDPSQPDNLAALGLEVQAQQADLGIAFDGDGDRIGVVDENGDIVRPEHLLMLLAGDVLLRHPGSDIVYDIKSSRHLAAFILANGGRPIMWRSGHARMKEKMRDSGALLGGEYSGHYFIKERWYGSDDAVYVAARLLEVFAADQRSLSGLVAQLPCSPATPELQLPLQEGEAATLMRRIEGKAVFDGAKIVDMDGLRVEFNDGWGLVRPSNTVPALTFRFEADTEPALEQIQQQFRELLNQVLPGRQLPF